MSAPFNYKTSSASVNGVSVTTKGDLQGYSTTAARLPVGTNGWVLYSNSADSLGIGWQVPQQTPAYAVEREYDMLGSSAGAEVTWVTTVSGTGSATTFNASTTTDGTRCGQCSMACGTTTSGSGILGVSNVNIYLGNGAYYLETDIYLSALSNGTDTYQIAFGLKTSFGTGNQTAGTNNYALLMYNSTVNSGNWVCGTSTTANSNSTTTNTSTAAVATTWTRLGIVVNAAGTQVDFYINGVDVATINTNTMDLNVAYTPQVSILKTAGTTSRTLTTDYFYWRKEFTTGR